MSALPVLIVTKEGENARSHPLDSDLSIGRGEGNVVRLEDRAVSRKHALVRKTPEGIQIEKQSDFAPIRLNGVECTRALLKEGDVVEIGPYRMRLDDRKEEKKIEAKVEKREEKRAAEPAPLPELTAEIPSPLADFGVAEVPPVSVFGESVADGNQPTIALADSSEEANAPALEALPTDATLLTSEVPSENIMGDLTAQLDMGTPSLAQPILADTAGAESASQDPGTNIFGSDAPAGAGEAPALNIDFDLKPDAQESSSGPEDVTSLIDENAPTKMVRTGIDARLDIPDGLANVKSFDITKDEVSIGRGKECDIVLNDKKSSRKNTILVKNGNRYLVRDLESSNGTYVNGLSVKERELNADDIIRIGEVEIHFIALNPEYERKKDQFLPVDPGPLSAPFAAHMPATPDLYAGIGGEVPPVVGAFPAADAAPAKARGKVGGIYDKYIKNFSSLKGGQKLLVVLTVGLFLSWYFEDELGLGEAVKAPTRKVAKKNPDAKAGPGGDYDRLSTEKRAQIDDAIRKATDFLRLMDFDKAIYEVQQKVYPILPEYPQAKEIERYAQEGKRRKDAIAEETRKKEEAEKLRLRIVELEQQTRDLMGQHKYEAAKETFSEILALDPENSAVSDWKKEIEAWMEEQSRIEQERMVQAEINKRAWDTYNEAFDLHKAGKYREAIPVYKKVPELGSNDESLLKKVRTMIQTCQDSIRELRDPHLVKAKELEASGDLAAAFKEYQVATEVDPPHPAGWAGMDRIRDVLNERAKILYTEAVIAESYSDFKTAHTKFKEILQMAPDGSLYHQRAQRKLQSYLNFKSDEEGAVHE